MSSECWNLKRLFLKFTWSFAELLWLGGMEEEREFFLRSNKAFSGYLGLEGGELQSFRSCLKWVCVDQSNLWRTGLSWSIFFVLAIGVPILSHFLFSCSSCDDKHARPYDVIVQLSLSSLAALSFISLSALVKKYGLRRSLFLDKLCDVSEKVRLGYTQQLHVCFSSPFSFIRVWILSKCERFLGPSSSKLAGPSCVVALLLNLSGFPLTDWWIRKWVFGI